MQYINYKTFYKIPTKMQMLQLRLKLIIEWIKAKKHSISQLVTHHLPIFRAIRTFIEDYIGYMQDLIKLVEKVMRDTSSGSGDSAARRTLLELFDLIRQKELVSVDEWRDKLLAIDQKFNTGAVQNKPFPDIFKDIDSNIEYYTQLRNKLCTTIQKSQSNKNKYHIIDPILTQKAKTQQDEDRSMKVFRTYAEQRRRTDLYADIYDFEYARRNSNENRRRGDLGRETGKIRTSPKQNNEQYSPYKLVNPKYSPHKIQDTRPKAVNKAYSPNYTTTSPRNFPQPHLDKYQQYKTQLLSQVRRQVQIPPQPQSLRPKYTAKRYLLDESPVKNYDIIGESREYSTAYTDRYGMSDGVGGQYWSDGKRNMGRWQGNVNNEEEFMGRGKQIGRKYQYLFEDEEVDYKRSGGKNITNPQFYPKGPKYQFLPPAPSTKKRGLFDKNNDSLEEDKLRADLEMDMPVIFNNNEKNLEQLLASSLMQSKRWGQSQHGSSSQHSEQDSLDDPEHHIQQTGKFKQLRYTDEDQPQLSEHPQNKRTPVTKFNIDQPLTIQKQISSESRDLNMSFGRN